MMLNTFYVLIYQPYTFFKCVMCLLNIFVHLLLAFYWFIPIMSCQFVYIHVWILEQTCI